MNNLYLQIATETELNSLRRALEMQYEMENDIVLDEIVLQARQVRELATLSDDEINHRLIEMREETGQRIDNLLATTDLRIRLENSIK